MEVFMKKKLIALLLIVLAVTACTSKPSTSKPDDFMSGYEGFNKTDHHFVQESAEDFITNLENKKSGIYYLGFDTCPWCIALVPVLEEVATDANQKINYLDAQGVDFKGNEELGSRLDTFIKSLPTDQQNNGYVPFLIAISPSGSIKTHLGTVDTHEDPSKPLTESELDFLTIRLKEMFKTLQS